MSYLGDFPLAGTVEFGFNTRQADGTPITLVGGTLAVYKNAVAGPLTLVPPPVLVVGLNGVTGLHHVTVSLTDADFVAGEYKVVLSAGTVDAIPVAGTVLACFSICMRPWNAAVLPDSIDWTHTVTLDGAVCAGAIVTYCSDAAYAAEVQKGVSDAAGEVDFHLPAGHYYVKVEAPGQETAYDEEDVA